MSDVKQDVKPEAVVLKVPLVATPKVVVPEFDQYVNVVLTKENYGLVKEAVTKNPAKLQKIMQYVNQLPQDQLKEVFSRSVY